MNPEPISTPVTLDNCASEPIHIPGHIQPHGALLGFSPGGQLAYISATAADVLGVGVPALGQRMAAHDFADAGDVSQSISRVLSDHAPDGPLAIHAEVQLGGSGFDLIIHRSGDTVVAEFEKQPARAPGLGNFAILAHRGMDRLRRQESIQVLLEVAVDEVRKLTGFDRVMAYRFAPDGSGDVVAESRRADLTPYLNQRYPASDIPAQARRLYVISTLRLIADVGAAAVPMHGLGVVPLDMSHCVLRSVSPVHIEYLTNMGVGASMSVSIVIGGQLWGMVACHHMTPRLVPYPVRMACDVMAQILAANVQTLTAVEHAARLSRAGSLRAALSARMLRTDESTRPMADMTDELLDTFGAGAALFFEDARLTVHGDVPMEAARALLAWLTARPRDDQDRLLAVNSLEELPGDLALLLHPWCGLLAGCFDEFSGGWLVLMRKQQLETVSWGHRPAPNTVIGPLGARLTPQGSFDVWVETITGRAVPWTAADLEIAGGMFDELSRTSGHRNAQLSKAKDLMMAVLGHDLRTPLQTINMAAHVMGKSAVMNEQMSRRIQTSSDRMERLIGQALDLSRLQSGLGLNFQKVATDVSELLDSVVDELATTYPSTTFSRSIEPAVTLQVDPDRLVQLLVNLLSNSHHHGAAAFGVKASLSGHASTVQLEVRNAAPPIAPEISGQLFVPFKRQAAVNQRNTGGMGLGLYIAYEIARGHGGTLAYSYDHQQGHVVFTAELPR